MSFIDGANRFNVIHANHLGRYTSGQSYKASTIVIYNSRVIPDLKIPHITTLDSKLQAEIVYKIGH